MARIQASRDQESGDYRTVIETPKGSRNKYRYDPDCDCFELATTLPDGMAFPFDFGFIPSTLGDDGDPLDVLVLMDSPVMAGCILGCRPIGVIEARDKGTREALGAKRSPDRRREGNPSTNSSASFTRVLFASIAGVDGTKKSGSAAR